jgi:hypothetical protein
MSRQKTVPMQDSTCDRQTKLYVLALEKENAKLQKRIARLRVQVLSQQNEIAALKETQPKLEVHRIDFDKAQDRNEKGRLRSRHAI